MQCCARLSQLQYGKVQCVPAPYVAALSTIVTSKGVCHASAARVLRASEQSSKQWPRYLICHAARGKDGRNGMPAATDAAGLLQALVQLASRSTIVVGSHQAYALLDALEPQLLQQVAAVPTDTLASGFWAMTRLQLQPSEELVAAAAKSLVQPLGAERDIDSSKTDRLQLCSGRTLGTLYFCMNFFMLRDPAFWQAAAAAGLPHVQALKPAGLSNLLQGIAASGWTVNPGMLKGSAAAAGSVAAGPQRTAAEAGAVPSHALNRHNVNVSSRAIACGNAGREQPTDHDLQEGSNILTEPSGQSSRHHHNQQHQHQQQQHCANGQHQGLLLQDPVLTLLTAVEQFLITQPQQLRIWRMRDISQLCQAYALTGFNCSPLFAVVANHLLDLEVTKPATSPLQPQDKAAFSSRDTVATRPFQQPPQQQVMGRLGRLQQQQQPPQQQQPWRVGQQGSVWQLSRRDWHAKGRGPGRLLECRAGDAAGLAWAFVHSFCPNKLLLHELAEVVKQRAGQLHAADCSRLLWAYATAGVIDQQMLAAVTAACAEEIHSVLPRTAAGAIWSLAMMGFEAPGFMEAALDRLADCLQATPIPAAASSSSHKVAAGQAGVGNATASAELTATEPSSILQQLFQSPSAVVLSGGPEGAHGPSGELSRLSLTSSRVRRINSSRSSQQPEHQQPLPPPGAATTSSTASNGSSSNQCQMQPQQQEHVITAGYMAGDVVTCTPRDVAEAVYACAHLQHYNASFFRVLRGKFKGLLRQFSGTQLVEVMWGLAKLNLYDSDNMEAAAAELAARAPGLPGPQVALTAWAFAALRHTSPTLSAALHSRAIQLAQQQRLKGLDAAQLLRAAAKMGAQNSSALFKACSQVLLHQMPKLSNSLVVGCLWSYAVAGVLDGDIFAAGFKQLSSLPPDKARPLMLLQLFQAATLLEDSFETAGLPPPARPPAALMAAATRQWMFSNRRSAGKSRFQVEVAKLLEEQLGLTVHQEVLTEDRLFSIDAAVEWQGRWVAVEVDGPDHFTLSTPHLLLGSSRAKHRCLQARGWAVLSVPFFLWGSLGLVMPQQQQQQPGARQSAAPWSGGSSVPRLNHPASTGAAADQVAAAVKAARADWMRAALDNAVAWAAVPAGLQQTEFVLPALTDGILPQRQRG